MNLSDDPGGSGTQKEMPRGTTLVVNIWDIKPDGID